MSDTINNNVENPVSIKYIGDFVVISQLTGSNIETVLIHEDNPIAKVLLSNWDKF